MTIRHYIRTSDTTAALDAALAQAQGAITTPSRSGTGSAGSGNNRRTYSYATITDVLEALRKPCLDAGLSHTKSYHIDRQAGWLHCVLRIGHAGEWMEFDLGCSLQRKFGNEVFIDLSPQAVGSAVTYLHRYLLQSAFGIAGEDDDGAAAQHQQQRRGSSHDGRQSGGANDERKRLFSELGSQLRRLKCTGRPEQDFFISGLANRLGEEPRRFTDAELRTALEELKTFSVEQARGVFAQLQSVAAERAAKSQGKPASRGAA